MPPSITDTDQMDFLFVSVVLAVVNCHVCHLHPNTQEQDLDLQRSLSAEQ